MNGFILFLTGACLYVLTEIFWWGRSHWFMALSGGAGMLLLRRFLLRFPHEDRLLLCLAGAVTLLALRYLFTHLSLLLDRKRKKGGPFVPVPFGSAAYLLYRSMLIPPAYTIIEYLHRFFGM